MAYLERNGVKIYYEVHGRGPAILLTHGFSATSAMWQPQLEALSSAHTVIVWDMRGHGLTAAPEQQQAYTESETTADMAAVLDAAGFEHAIIGRPLPWRVYVHGIQPRFSGAR